MTPTPLLIQYAHGYAGCSGVLSVGCQVAVDIAVADRGDQAPESGFRRYGDSQKKRPY